MGMDWQLFAGLTRRTSAGCSRSRGGGASTATRSCSTAATPATRCTLIGKGRFAVRITTQLGDTATLAVFGPGEAFGELALLSSDRFRSATVVALEPAETYSVGGSDVQRLRREHPGVNEILIGLLAERVRQLNERLVEALFVPAETRVLRGPLPDEDVRRRVDWAVIPLTQEDIAGLAGTSRATVNRVLRDEERRGTVELGRGKTVVLDADDLARRRARRPAAPRAARGRARPAGRSRRSHLSPRRRSSSTRTTSAHRAGGRLLLLAAGGDPHRELDPEGRACARARRRPRRARAARRAPRRARAPARRARRACRRSRPRSTSCSPTPTRRGAVVRGAARRGAHRRTLDVLVRGIVCLPRGRTA